MCRRHDSIVGRADYESSSSFSTAESDSDISSCESSIPKKAKRQLTVATFQKWQRIHEQEHQTLI